MRLEYSEEADRNLDQIRARFPDAAKQIAEGITERARQLELFPYSGQLVPKWEDVGLRVLLEGRYLIVYAVGVETIVILGIKDARRDR